MSMADLKTVMQNAGLNPQPSLLPQRKRRAGVEQLVEVARYGVSYEQVAGGPQGALDRELNEWARRGYRITRIDDWERMVFTYVVFKVEAQPVEGPVEGGVLLPSDEWRSRKWDDDL
jgi:hypothetical protein